MHKIRLCAREFGGGAACDHVSIPRACGLRGRTHPTHTRAPRGWAHMLTVARLLPARSRMSLTSTSLSSARTMAPMPSIWSSGVNRTSASPQVRHHHGLVSGRRQGGGPLGPLQAVPRGHQGAVPEQQPQVETSFATRMEGKGWCDKARRGARLNTSSTASRTASEPRTPRPLSCFPPTWSRGADRPLSLSPSQSSCQLCMSKSTSTASRTHQCETNSHF